MIQSSSAHQEKLQRGPKPAVCDLCHLWKVKCDKVRPSCSKCLALKVECKYSRSGPKPTPVERPKGVRTYAKRKSKNSELVSLVFPARPLNLTILSKESFTQSTPNTNSFKISSKSSQHTKSILKSKLASESSSNFQLQKSSIKKIRDPSGFSSSILDILFDLNKKKVGHSKPTLIWEERDGTYFCTGKSIASGFFHSNANLFPILTNEPEPSLLSKKDCIPVVSDVTNTLQNQLLDLYFGCINAFYPAIHPPTFYANLSKPDHKLEFKALICAVSLLGSTLYPDPSLAKGLGILYSCQLDKFMKQLYLKPSLEMVQVYALISFHITSYESDPVYASAWYYLGLGQRMASLLGFQSSCHSRTRHLNQVYCRTYWVLTLNEVLINHCTGLPSWQGTELLSIPPDSTTVYPFMNIVSQDIFKVKEVLSVSPLNSSLFFLNFCLYIRLLSYFNCPRQSKVKESKPIPRPSFNIDFLLNGVSPPPVSKTFLIHFHSLEVQFFNWHKNLPDFYPSSNTKPGTLSMPDPKDFFGTKLFVYFMTILIDLNKVQISHKNQKLDATFNFLHLDLNLSYDLMKSQHPLGKCVLAAHLAAEAIHRSEFLLPEIAAPYFWYCTVQIVFFLSLTLDFLPQTHEMHNFAIMRLKYMRDIMKDNANRWIVIKDSYTLVLTLFKKWLP